jgi:protein phosphatase
MQITLPELSLVALVGASGSGKSTFARRHFKATEILSSDFFRGMVCDDETSQAASKDAFELLHFAAAKRLAGRKFTVIDATNVKPEARRQVLDLAKRYHYLPAALVFNLPEEVCRDNNRRRPDRQVEESVIRWQLGLLHRSLRRLREEGFKYVYVLNTPEEMAAATIERTPLWTDRRGDRGPFDIIGDVHGCFDELCTLLGMLGYEIAVQSDTGGEAAYMVRPPQGRKAVFVGDLVDRGPNVPAVLRLVMGMVEAGAAYCVIGNHDNKCARYLGGHNVRMTHGLAETAAQLDREPPAFKEKARRFLDGLLSHYVFDAGKVVVAHAGLSEELQGRASARVRDFAMYGATTGKSDEHGLPERLNWAADYRGEAAVVYGHTPVASPEWVNRTVNIDTGCVFGGALTALRYPEREFVSTPALREYCPPNRPFLTAPGQQQADDVLDLADVTGARTIHTRLMGDVRIRAENSAAALEAMSRFGANPKWLIYLPPRMSPCETSREPGVLEHPAEALAYYRGKGAGRVVCQQKHMGSRAVAVVCRDAGAARRRFGVAEDESGIVYTRTGRRFFDDPKLEAELLERLRRAWAKAGLWEKFATDWFCLDCELMPWSAKAQELLRSQYAAVGGAARAALGEVATALSQASAHTPEAAALHASYGDRAANAERYVAAYRRYCWPVRALDDLKLAPFHLLATEAAVHADKNHLWHMEQLTALCQCDAGVLHATAHHTADLADPANCEATVNWWRELTDAGGEGMVVKPLDFVARAERGLAQPAMKCRGPEYLRIIYGPDYTAAEHLERLRQRGLGTKRGLALREFALGIEGLERFVKHEPLRRVHECAFGVLALESEPVDPRL